MHLLITRKDRTTVDNSLGRSRNVWIPHFLPFLGKLSCGLNFPLITPLLAIAGAIWKLPVKVKHTAAALLCHKHCIDGARGGAVSALWFKSCNLQSPVFPVMVLATHGLTATTVTTRISFCNKLQHLNFSPCVATQNMFW